MRPGFYGDNAGRRYPFINTSTPGIAFPIVVDCGFSFAAYSGFDPKTHRVWLKRIAASGSNYVFTFATDATEISGIELSFTVDNAAEFATVMSEATGTFGDDPCEAQLAWYGYLVVGRLIDMPSLPYAPGSPIDIVEPALLQNTDGTYVRSVHLANEKRTTIETVPGVAREIIVAAECLQGPLTFRPGFNCSIGVDMTQNALVFSGSVGAGAGEACDEVKQFAEEVSPDGGALLSGGPLCKDLVRTLNGLPGPFIRLRGENGIRVHSNEETPHTLIITRI